MKRSDEVCPLCRGKKAEGEWYCEACRQYQDEVRADNFERETGRTDAIIHYKIIHGEGRHDPE